MQSCIEFLSDLFGSFVLIDSSVLHTKRERNILPAVLVCVCGCEKLVCKVLIFKTEWIHSQSSMKSAIAPLILDSLAMATSLLSYFQ